MVQKNDSTKLAVIAEKISNIEKTVTDIKSKIDADLITKDEVNLRLKPLEDTVSLLQKIVYGVIGLLITSVVGGIMALVINKPN